MSFCRGRRVRRRFERTQNDCFWKLEWQRGNFWRHSLHAESGVNRDIRKCEWNRDTRWCNLSCVDCHRNLFGPFGRTHIGSTGLFKPEPYRDGKREVYDRDTQRIRLCQQCDHANKALGFAPGGVESFVLTGWMHRIQSPYHARHERIQDDPDNRDENQSAVKSISSRE